MARFGEFFNPYAEIEMHGSKLPHWQQSGALYFLTWRLADSIPAEVLRDFVEQRNALRRRGIANGNMAESAESVRRLTLRLERVLDDGRGSCVFRERACRASLERAIGMSPIGRIDSFIIMPNHVHLIVGLETGASLPNWVMLVKGRSACAINRMKGRRGKLWQGGYWDRIIRDEEHLDRCRRYISGNPSKAGLKVGTYSMRSPAEFGTSA